MGKRPTFVSVLQDDFVDKLRIPPAFSKHIPKDAPNKVILKGPSGCRWTVGLAGNRSGPAGFYFKRGWDSFVNDHFLDEDDLLFFKYDGGRNFSVLIFDKTCCEKDYAFPPKKSSAGDSYAAAGNVEKKMKKRKLADQSSPALKSTGETKGTDPGSFKSKFPFFNKILPAVSFQRAASLMYIPSKFHEYVKMDHELVLRDSEGKKWPVLLKRCAGKVFIRNGWREFSEANDLKVGDTCIFELRDRCTFWVHCFPDTSEANAKKVKSEFDIVPLPVKNNSSESNPRSFTSNFPFFIKFLTGYSLKENSSLLIPSSFYCHMKRDELVFLHFSGRKWPVFIKQVSQRRGQMAAGDWCALCKAIMVKVGDTCIFELRTPSMIWVHISRCQ